MMLMRLFAWFLTHVSPLIFSFHKILYIFEKFISQVDHEFTNKFFIPYFDLIILRYCQYLETVIFQSVDCDTNDIRLMSFRNDSKYALLGVEYRDGTVVSRQTHIAIVGHENTCSCFSELLWWVEILPDSNFIQAHNFMLIDEQKLMDFEFRCSLRQQLAGFIVVNIYWIWIFEYAVWENVMFVGR